MPITLSSSVTQNFKSWRFYIRSLSMTIFMFLPCASDATETISDEITAADEKTTTYWEFMLIFIDKDSILDFSVIKNELKLSTVLPLNWTSPDKEGRHMRSDISGTDGMTEDGDYAELPQSNGSIEYMLRINFKRSATCVNEMQIPSKYGKPIELPVMDASEETKQLSDFVHYIAVQDNPKRKLRIAFGVDGRGCVNSFIVRQIAARK